MYGEKKGGKWRKKDEKVSGVGFEPTPTFVD